MPEKLCVFLRGVNVNGVSIRMDALRELFVRIDCEDAKTVLATGNVILTLPQGADRLSFTKAAEQALGETFGYEAHVLLRSREELAAVLTAAKALDVPAGCHLYYLLYDDSALSDELSQLFEKLPHRECEGFFPVITGAFWVVPKGETLVSEFGSKTLGSKQFRSRLTSRNIGTVQKVLAAMEK